MNRKLIWTCVLSGIVAILLKAAVSDLLAQSPQTPIAGQTRTPNDLQEAHAERERSEVKALINTPIVFYGKVVNEKGNPINGAKIVMYAADNPYMPGSKYERTSDAGGLFSINGIHGIGLSVDVSKEGYYRLPQSVGNFGYAVQGGDEKPPHPDPKDPAVFILKQRGKSESLIVIKNDVKLNPDGTPLPMDLRTGKTYGLPNPDIQVSCRMQDRNRPANSPHYDWRFAISVRGGGIQIRKGDEFNFTAPESGYNPIDEISMSASAGDWNSVVTREYYLKLADGSYARMNVTMHVGGDNVFSIKSYLNPIPGHTNLEFDPSQQSGK
jgi:hypothetical protein